MAQNLQTRMEVVERLTKLFELERLVYLITTIISLLILVGSGLSIMLKNPAGTNSVELTLLFGSSGVMAYTTNCLLYMWSETLKRLIPYNEDKGAE